MLWSLGAPGSGSSCVLKPGQLPCRWEEPWRVSGPHSKCLTYFYAQFIGRTCSVPPSPHREDRTAALQVGGRGPGTSGCAQANSGGVPDPFLVCSLQQKPSGVGVACSPAERLFPSSHPSCYSHMNNKMLVMFWGTFWERGYKGQTQPIPSPLLLPGPHEGDSYPINA